MVTGKLVVAVQLVTKHYDYVSAHVHYMLQTLHFLIKLYANQTFPPTPSFRSL